MRPLPLLCVAVMVMPAAAQAVLTRASDVVPRYHAAVAYEPNTAEGYVFGGTLSPFVVTWRNDLWRFLDGGWLPVATVNAPPPLPMPVACTWPGHGMLVCSSGQTWLFDGANWSAISTVHVPPDVLAMAYDDVRAVVVAFVPNTPPYTSQVWEFDGVDWLHIVPAFTPPTLPHNAMAWDGAGQRCLLQISGGNGSAVGKYTWDGTAWTTHSIGGAGLMGYCLATAPNQTGVLIAGGFAQPFNPGATYLWSTTSMTLPSAGAPPLRPVSQSWFDSARGRTVITSTAPGNMGSWYWNGLAWSQAGAGRQLPAGTQSLTYDSWRGRMLSFGGYHIHSFEIDELWQLQAGAPSLLGSSLGSGATARYMHAAAFDTWRGRLVVFGGARWDAGGAHYLPLLDLATYEWDGQSWFSTPMPGGPWQPNTHPNTRLSPAMAFDRQRGRTVLFGGAFINSVYSPVWRNDTYEWDGAAWTLMQPANSPPAAGVRLFFDAARGQCVAQVANLLWAWDGTDWTQLAIPLAPGVVDYDTSRGLYVAFAVNVAYELTNGVWQLAPLPSAFSMGFDPSQGRFVGSDNFGLYTYGDLASAKVGPFGNGCAGFVGVPVLHGEDPPRVGRTFSLHVAKVPPAAVYVGMLGADPFPALDPNLPIDLSSIGMTGCVWQVLVAAHELRTGRDWPIVVPNAPSLLGGRFHCQALVLDPAANPLGATTTNAMALRVGA